MQLYLLRYNNYYNRQIKREFTVDDYAQYCISNNFQTAPMVTQNPVVNLNFKPNDGVDTTVDINWYGDIPDYVVLAEAQQILSRWFVLDAHRLRDGQYRLQLYRDTIVDYWEEFSSSPVFVEKGMIEDIGNPLLYNAENVSLNQLRKDIKYLADSSDCAWVVGYIPQDYAGGNLEINNNFPSYGLEDVVEVDTLEDWDYYKYCSLRGEFGYKEIAYDIDNIILETKMYYDLPHYVLNQSLTTRTRTLEYIWTTTSWKQYAISNPGTNQKAAVSRTAPTDDNTAGNELFNHIINYGTETYKNGVQEWKDSKYGTESDFSAIKDLGVKVLLDRSTGIYYRVTPTVNPGIPEFWKDLTTNNGYQLLQAIVSCLPNTSPWQRNLESFWSVPPGYFQTRVSVPAAFINLEPISGYSKLKVEIPLTANRIHCMDQPFDIFCMPYSSAKKIWLSNAETTYINSSAEVALTVGQSLTAATGSGAVYDVQLLPYCPIPNIVSGDGLRGYIGTSDIKSVIDGQEDELVGRLWWVSSSELTTTITLPEPITAQTDPINAKVKSQTEFARLVAPNYSKYFDFSIQKNGGLSNFLLQMSLRPFNPWIKITPYFNSNTLYSTPDLAHDARGLILSGDFSLSQATDAWSTYELNNKNYMNIFDRQIQSMEFNRDVSRWEGGISGAAGTIAGIGGGVAAGGAISAYASGGTATPLGMAIGGIAGGIGSALTGGMDWMLREKKMNEAIDYTQDLFGFQLGNIKALPQGLARTTAINGLNTLVPTLELWGTTTQEEQALYNKIKYNGMTIGIIDTLENWITENESYLKVALIRCENLSDDTHLLRTISSELNKGVFIGEHTIYV